MLKILLCLVSLLGIWGVPVYAQETFPYVAEVVVNNAHLRAGQNKNFETLTQLNPGDDLVVLAESFEWRKVKLPASAKVYINEAYVKDLGDSIYQVKGNRLNVRAGASVNSTILCQIKSGEMVRVFEKNNGWLRIDPPDSCVGWIYKENIKFKTKDIPAARIVLAPAAKLNPESSGIPGAVTTTGVVEELLGKNLSADIRHQCLIDGKPVYYLHGFRRVLDGFINQKVKIEGRLEPDFKSDKPILLVTKISLVL